MFHILILHQTTTHHRTTMPPFGCFISWFYIKPQLILPFGFPNLVVSYLDSTSNHNCFITHVGWVNVVSYLDSTSNHNSYRGGIDISKVVSYLDSTSNHNSNNFLLSSKELFHILILHQTTTLGVSMSKMSMLFHILILHQTTTLMTIIWHSISCFISWFYIKPQLQLG